MIKAGATAVGMVVATKKDGRTVFGYFTGNPATVEQYLHLKGVDDEIECVPQEIVHVTEEMVENLVRLRAEEMELLEQLEKVKKSLNQ
jgi:hypothetical protein